ncbi:FAD-binding oxidoreductase [Mesorhizobium sp. M7D.F.Ca.US.005.01.1.1]|uniref:FAD-binding oxidoreductase n=1 Tax=Mesorhizobium sp. M7D.F.Ca.US.005.01.1.1 TaxID=2493678 RepID=UPI000F7594FE|nr:FAD-binding oxidoreductase [Mesorhizobium sp. M7D.F.Ca.US.005.01.1.1]AZO42260.1 FAD-binding oxidoreductase [Mesorhizobium sp. M7D.F.Ca.US.005.01.1.1]
MTEISDKLDPALIDRFAAIVGDKYALRDEQDIAPYLIERRGLWHGATSLVLRPGSVDEVSRIMRLATETGTPIVPQSGNTGLVGAQVPDTSGREIILSLSRLNRIREIDVLSNTVTAEAGVILQTLQEAADAADRLFPLSLAAQGSCQIGGNLSSNAGGTGVLAYGNARELCLGVEVVLPTGEVFDDLRKLKKDNTGYDLKNLFVGAEGTLGVITAAVLKLFPKPKGREVAFVGLSSPEAALSLFSLAMDRAGAALTAFELIGKRPYDFTLAHAQGVVRPLVDDWPWYVLMQISSGRSSEDSRALIEDVLSAGLEHEFVGDAVIAASLGQGDAFWNFRELLPEAQKPEGASISTTSVPVAMIPRFIAEAAGAVASVSAGARVVCFGHMGDGNLHYNISRPVDGDDEGFLALYHPMNKAVHDVVRSLHGSISAEHGIGQLKRDELIATAPPMAIDLMRRVKAAFDPAGIMNPGKVI